jgi:hypothetical protein
MGWGGEMTHRQFIAWCAWDDKQWQHPTKTEYYLMQIAAEVHKVPHMFSKSRPNITLDKFKIPFTFGTKKPKRQLSLEEAAKRSKDYSMAMFGFSKSMLNEVGKDGEPKPTKYHRPRVVRPPSQKRPTRLRHAPPDQPQ